MLFIYVRHGDPIYDPDSLTPLGHEQAKSVAKRLALFGADKIFCSTSNRAIQTAMPTCELLKKEMITCDWANEAYAWHDFTIPKGDGRNWCFQEQSFITEFRSNKIKALGNEWYKFPDYANYNFEKGCKRIDKETDNFFLELGYRHERENSRYKVVKENDQRVVMFAHQAFGFAFLSSILDIPYPTFCTTFDIQHTGVTAILFSNCDGYAYPKILQLSNDSHLYKDGLITGYNHGIKF